MGGQDRPQEAAEPKRIVKSFAGAEEVRVATAADNGFDIMEDITLSSFEALKAKNKNWQPFQPKLPYVWPDPCARTLSINNAAHRGMTRTCAGS